MNIIEIPSKQRLKTLDEIEKMFFQTNSSKNYEQLIQWLNRWKQPKCPIGDEHYALAYRGSLVKAVEVLMQEHVDYCSVCFSIACLKLALHENGLWTHDSIRRMVLIRLRDERQIVEKKIRLNACSLTQNESNTARLK